MLTDAYSLRSSAGLSSLDVVRLALCTLHMAMRNERDLLGLAEAPSKVH